MSTSKAQKRAQARYDEKRPAPAGGRLSSAQREWVVSNSKPGEGLFLAMKRLLAEHCGMPEI